MIRIMQVYCAASLHDSKTNSYQLLASGTNVPCPPQKQGKTLLNQAIARPTKSQCRATHALVLSYDFAALLWVFLKIEEPGSMVICEVQELREVPADQSKQPAKTVVSVRLFAPSLVTT